MKTAIDTEMQVALEPGDYRDFTGYINMRGTEGYAEHATFMLSDRSRSFDSDIVPMWMTEAFTIVWQKGDWIGGTMYDGAFYGGTFRGGTFLSSCFHGQSMFVDGVFRRSTFYNGTWINGDWDMSKWLSGHVRLNGVDHYTAFGPFVMALRPAFRNIVEGNDD